MTTSENASKVGPRAKCDQVVYEAIAKAAEIIVCGRCDCLQQQSNASMQQLGSGTTMGMVIGSSTSLPSQYQQSGAGASTSRFHLEVEEVPMVR